MSCQEISAQMKEALEGLFQVAGLKPGQILVVGCSTSEVMGQKIGSASSLEVAEALMEQLLPFVQSKGVFLAIQGCEHINRALVVEEECAEKYGWEIVNVVPHQKAGGSLSAVAMERFQKPVVVERIQAHAGIDIGDTFIGMHLRPVAVPVRLSLKSMGQAHLTLARTRPRLIGGERARYCK